MERPIPTQRLFAFQTVFLDQEFSLTLYSGWWFAATAFPMIAGTFAPVALAFGICSIVEPWRDSVLESTPKNEGYTIKNPRW